MKKVLFICALLLSLLTSCEKEFNPRDKYKDITVVYGVVNPVDEVHYIRVHKAFLGPDDIIVMAKNPDSSIYPVEDIEVRVYEVAANGNSTLIQIAKDTIIKNKEQGNDYFSYPEQLVYKFERKFEKSQQYGNDYYLLDDILKIKIEVENKKSGKIVYAETPLVNSFYVTSPMTGTPLTLDPSKTASKFIWNNAKNGRIYDVYYTMRYREGRHVDPSTQYERKSLEWHVGSHSAQQTGNGTQTENFQFNPGAFYAQIQRDIKKDESLWRTPYDSVKVAIWCGSEDLYYYHNINDPSQGVAQERPEYTNMKAKIYSEELGAYQELADEAFGIFASRIVQYRWIHLSAEMIQIYLPATDRQFKGVAYED